MKGLAALVLLSSCAVVGLSKNAVTLSSLVTVRGEVREGFPTFLVLFREDRGTLERVSSRVLYAPATFELASRPGTLTLYAFSSATGAWSPGALSALRKLPNVPDGKIVELGQLAFSPSGPAPPEPIDFNAPDAPPDRVVVHRGDIATLYDERFSFESGRLSLWKPIEFAQKYGMGVSFLEPYDPRKTPVLFVHGASGTPLHFRTIIAALDRTRFQPWVFSYPSGSRLGSIATNLTEIVDDLHTKLGFKRVMVVGYSMGGLIAHSFAARSTYVSLLITLSAPYGGDGAARTAIGLSPVVMPFWIDMAEGSPFLLSLRKPMTAKHVLFFSYRGRGDDGLVALSTMLVPEVQQAAIAERAFNETHESIVNSEEVAQAVNAALLQALPH